MTEESTPTNDKSEPASTGSHAGADDVQYQYMSVKAIRGREGATKAKWQEQGWESIDQTQGTLRSALAVSRYRCSGGRPHARARQALLPYRNAAKPSDCWQYQDQAGRAEKDQRAARAER